MGVVVDESDLIVIHGCICCNLALYPEIPDCIGVSGKCECCCAVGRVCLKCGVPPLTCCDALGDEVCCQIGLCCVALGCKCPSTICKRQQQICCLVENAAFPTDDEIPCSLALCFCMCHPSCGCCQRLKMKIHKTTHVVEVEVHHSGGPAAPDGVVVAQPLY